MNVTPQGQFCVVNLTVRDPGSQQQIWIDAYQRLVTATGERRAADSRADIYATPDGKPMSIAVLKPGEQATGNIVFDIPKDATVTAVELHQTERSSGATVKVG
jgi:hypothetical protein